MAPEMEMLDQLLGDPLPMRVILGLFPSLEHAYRAIHHSIAEHLIEVVDVSGRMLELWQWDELCRGSDRERDTQVASLRVRITDAGAKRVQ